MKFAFRPTGLIIMKGENMAKVGHFEVQVDDFKRKVRKHGGTMTMVKTQLTGIGHIAYRLDSGGNAFGLWEVK